MSRAGAIPRVRLTSLRQAHQDCLAIGKDMYDVKQKLGRPQLSAITNMLDNEHPADYLSLRCVPMLWTAIAQLKLFWAFWIKRMFITRKDVTTPEVYVACPLQLNLVNMWQKNSHLVQSLWWILLTRPTGNGALCRVQSKSDVLFNISQLDVKCRYCTLLALLPQIRRIYLPFAFYRKSAKMIMHGL